MKCHLRQLAVRIDVPELFSLYLNFPFLHFLFLSLSPSISFSFFFLPHIHFAALEIKFLPVPVCNWLRNIIRHTFRHGLQRHKWRPCVWPSLENKANHSFSTCNPCQQAFTTILMCQLRGDSICRVMNSYCRVLCYLQEDIMLKWRKASSGVNKHIASAPWHLQYTLQQNPQ